jgi:hypothetical protein
MGHELIVSHCINCGNVLTFLAQNAERINSVPILPETGRPVDVQVVDGEPVPRDYTPEELARARGNRQPLCLNCAERLAENMKAKGLTPPPIDRKAYDVPA